MKKLLLLFFSFILLSSLIAQPAKEKPIRTEKPLYYKVIFNNEHTGWEMDQTIEYRTKIVYSTERSMKMADLDGKVKKVKTTSKEVDDKSGKLLEFHYNETTQGQKRESLFSVDAKNPFLLNITTKDENKIKKIRTMKTTQKLESVAEILQKIKQKKVWRKGDTITRHDFDIDAYIELDIIYTFVKSEKMKVLGKEEKVYHFTQKIVYPNMTFHGETIIRPNGDTIYDKQIIMNQVIELVLAPQKEAKAVKKSLNVAKDALIPAPIVQRNHRNNFFVNIVGWRYVLENKDDSITKLSNYPRQKVKKDPKTKNQWILEITMSKPKEKMAWPYKGKDQEALDNLKASDHIEVNEPEIKKLAETAVKGQNHADAYATAEHIVNFTRFFITNKNYDHGQDTALQTLRSRSGDCTEHSYLAVALCRASGIPARSVYGFVYHNISSDKYALCGHQWMEVYINGAWYPLDPALGTATPGHVCTGIDNANAIDILEKGMALDILRNAKILKIEEF
jgi:hypothetical protein